MKLAVLFSGGKDSAFAAFLAKKFGHSLNCLITLNSENEDSFMFHTPTINLTKKQANLMSIPHILVNTSGKKESELKDLEKALMVAIKKYKIEGVVTGAVESVYQSSRIQKICNRLSLECFNPLWQKNQIELLNDLVKNKFKAIISAVAAYPLDKKWIGRAVDKDFIKEVTLLQDKYKINPAGEGGEFESLVLDCPLFKRKLDIKLVEMVGEKNSWRGIWK